MHKTTESRSTTVKAGALLALALTTGAASALAAEAAAGTAWVATWQASPQPVWGPDFLFSSNVPEELRDQTVRQIARISLGGPRLRLVLSNAYGRQPVTVGKTTLARAGQGGDGGAWTDGSLRTVTFGGRETAVIPPGASLLSDPVSLPVSARAQVVVSAYLPQATPVTTFHWDGRQTGWIAAGDQTKAAALPEGARQQTTARLLLTGIQVEAPEAARAIAIARARCSDVVP